jgi:hypothetical protein
MDYFSVSSSNVAAVGYESETNTLGVRFLDGSEYHYFGVPEDVFEGLRSASSVGSYLNQCVKKAGYSYSKVG